MVHAHSIAETFAKAIDDFKKCQSLSLLRKSWAFAMDVAIAEDNKGEDINLAAILRNLSSLHYSYLLKVIGGYKGEPRPSCVHCNCQLAMPVQQHLPWFYSY
jgi:hypothetical protein